MLRLNIFLLYNVRNIKIKIVRMSLSSERMSQMKGQAETIHGYWIENKWQIEELYEVSFRVSSTFSALWSRVRFTGKGCAQSSIMSWEHKLCWYSKGLYRMSPYVNFKPIFVWTTEECYVLFVRNIVIKVCLPQNLNILSQFLWSEICLIAASRSPVMQNIVEFNAKC